MFALHYISHPLLPHSSTPLLWYELVEIIVLLINMRTALSIGIPHKATGKTLFALLVLKLVGFVVLFSVECLGPDGWDDLTWRDLFTWLPFVKDEGRIKLRDNEQTETTGEYEQQICPRLRANIFSRLTFSWLTPMVKLGKRKFLTEEDLWALPTGDTAEELATRLEKAWIKRREKVSSKDAKQKASLTGSLFEAYGGPFMVAAVFKVNDDHQKPGRSADSLCFYATAPSRQSCFLAASAAQASATIRQHVQDRHSRASLSRLHHRPVHVRLRRHSDCEYYCCQNK